MAGPMVAGGLPPLLRMPTNCVSLRPPPASYAAPQPEGIKKAAGRASLSQNWNKDKLSGGGVSSDRSQESWTGCSGGGVSSDRSQESWTGCSGRSSEVSQGKMPGRASLSSSWVKDKEIGGAGTSTSSIERVGRPMWKDSWKRSASRAPSADRSEKKAKAPTNEDDILQPETQQYVGPTFIRSPKEATARTPSDQDDVLELETEQFAGPTFVLSPDPSKLPIPLWFASPEPSELPIPSFLKVH